jgi:hypothetical protein
MDIIFKALEYLALGIVVTGTFTAFFAFLYFTLPVWFLIGIGYAFKGLFQKEPAKET